MRTRLYSQPVNSLTGRGALYDGAADAARKIFEIEGAPAFYKGSPLGGKHHPNTTHHCTTTAWPQLSRAASEPPGAP